MTVLALQRVVPIIVFTFAILLPLESASSQEVTTFSVRYYKYCEGFNSAVKSNNVDDVAGFTNYVFGFVSAAAIYSGEDNLKDLGTDEVAAYMKRYCVAHPEITILKLARDLFNTHAGRE